MDRDHIVSYLSLRFKEDLNHLFEDMMPQVEALIEKRFERLQKRLDKSSTTTSSSNGKRKHSSSPSSSSSKRQKTAVPTSLKDETKPNIMRLLTWFQRWPNDEPTAKPTIANKTKGRHNYCPRLPDGQPSCAGCLNFLIKRQKEPGCKSRPCDYLGIWKMCQEDPDYFERMKTAWTDGSLMAEAKKRNLKVISHSPKPAAEGNDLTEPVPLPSSSTTNGESDITRPVPLPPRAVAEKRPSRVPDTVVEDMMDDDYDFVDDVILEEDVVDDDVPPPVE